VNTFQAEEIQAHSCTPVSSTGEIRNKLLFDLKDYCGINEESVFARIYSV
jgi:hypothetical protein